MDCETPFHARKPAMIGGDTLSKQAFFTRPTNRRLRRNVVHFSLTISGTDFAFWSKREIPAVSRIGQSADGDQQNDAE